MGVLLKWIIIIAIVYYLISKVGKFFFRTLTGTMPNEEPRTRQRNTQNKEGRRMGDIRVLFRPKNKRENAIDKFKGGEYVDYEEVD